MADHLPHSLNMVADAAGVEAALTLALKRGGTRLLIPKRAEGSILVDLVGIDAARKIVEHLANERIEIPLAARVLALWLHGQGWTQEAIANRLRRSRRTIQYWVTGTTPDAQSDLFDGLASPVGARFRP